MAVRRRGRRAGSTPAALPLPDVGRVVAVSLGDRSWTTRVEDSRTHRVQIVAPARPLGDPILPEAGEIVRVAWTTPTGRMVAEGELAETGVDATGIAFWRIDAHRVVRQQRRRSFRLEVTLPLALVWGDEAVETRTRDLSEHGVGCALPAATCPSEGEVVEVTVTLPDGEVVSGVAQVARERPIDAAPGPPRLVDVGLAFLDEDPRRAELVRRFVLEEQLRQRASARV